MKEPKNMKSNLSITPSRKRATIFQAVGGYINTGIIVVQGLLLIPLYLYYIEVHTYGLWLASGGILGMLSLMNFRISSILIQRIANAYGKQEHALAGAYFINGIVVYLFICLLFGMAGWGASMWVPSILGVAGDEAALLQNCFQLTVIAMTVGILNECLRSFSQALLRPVVPMVGMAIGRIVGIGVTVWMLFDSFGLWAIPMGTLAAELTILIVNLFNAVNLFRWLEFKITLDYKIIKEYVKTSPLLIMATTGNTISQEAEPLLITIFLSPEVTTAYMITRKAADMVFRMLSVVAGSTMGSFSHLAGNADKEKIKDVVKKLLILSFFLGTIGFASYVATNEFFVSLWVGELFVLDPNIILFIGLGFFARNLRGLMGQFLYGLGDFNHTSKTILLEGTGRIILAMVLLRFFGVIGVPLACSIACLVTTFIMGIRLTNKLGAEINYQVLTKLLFNALIVFGMSFIMVNLNLSIVLWNQFVIYLVLVMAVLTILYILINFNMAQQIYKQILNERV